MKTNQQTKEQSNTKQLLLLVISGLVFFCCLLFAVIYDSKTTPKEPVNNNQPVVQPPPAPVIQEPKPVIVPPQPQPSPQPKVEVPVPVVLPPPIPVVDKEKLDFCEKAKAFIKQCHKLNKLLANAPQKEDYQRQLAVLVDLFTEIPDNPPESATKSQKGIAKELFPITLQLYRTAGFWIDQRDEAIVAAISMRRDRANDLADETDQLAKTAIRSLKELSAKYEKDLSGIENIFDE